MRRAAIWIALLSAVTAAEAKPHRRPQRPADPPAREPPSRVARDLDQFDRAVAAIKLGFRSREPPQPQDPIWVARALAAMVTCDRYLRSELGELADREDYSAAERAQLGPAVARRFQLVDGANTGDLAALVSINGWITIGEFGEQANRDANLILLHADLDLAFQERILGALPPLIRQHDSDRDGFVMLLDRTAAVGDHIPQQFGTQGRCTGPGQWQPFPIDQPEHLDIRRRLFGLPPMAAYLRRMAARCRRDDPTPVP